MTDTATAECTQPDTLHRYRTLGYAEVSARAASRHSKYPLYAELCTCGLFHLSPTKPAEPQSSPVIPAQRQAVVRRPSIRLPVADPVIPDALWAEIKPLLPIKERRRKHAGRFPIDDRAVLTGILVILARGIGFEHLPQELGYGSGMTCWRRLRYWQDSGVWPIIVHLLKRGLPNASGIDFGRAAAGRPLLELLAPCPDCGQPVVRTLRVTLDAAPDPVGVFRIDGTPMRKAEFERTWSAERPVGRRVHLCGGVQRVRGDA